MRLGKQQQEHVVDAFRVPIDSLKPYPDNARKHAEEVIRASVRRFGQYRTIVVQRSTNFVIAGNGTWLAMKEEGFEHCDVQLKDVDDATARAIVVADNRTNDLAGYHDNALVELLQKVDDLSGTGYQPDDVKELLARIADDPAAGNGDNPDKGSLLALADVVVGEPTHQVEHGDVWILGGQHFLAVFDVVKEHAKWTPLLEQAGDKGLFVPYPGVFVPVTQKANDAVLVMVQPDKYLAGHVLDKYVSIRGEDSVAKQ